MRSRWENNRTYSLKNAVATLCLFALIVGAAAVLWIGVSRSLNAQASETWPTVSGTVTSTSSIIVPGKLFIELTYSYTVDGQTYENDRVSFSPKPSAQSSFDLFTYRSLFLSAAQKNEGSSITIYYQPDNPANSTLVPGGAKFFFIYGFAIILMLLVARVCYWIMTGRLGERFSNGT